MNSTQKRVLEWPLLLLLLWVEQGLEISISETLLFGLSSFQIVPILIVYLALTRPWGSLFMLSLCFAYLGSSNVGPNVSIFICAQMWTALCAKSLVYGLALENRRAFTLLSFLAFAFSKIITWTIMALQGQSVPWLLALKGFPIGIIVTTAAAWMLFPIFVTWDKFFEHEADNARDLNPTFSR